MKQLKPLVVLALLAGAQSIIPAESVPSLSIPQLQMRVDDLANAITTELLQNQQEEFGRAQEKINRLEAQRADINASIARINQSIEELAYKAGEHINEELHRYTMLRLEPQRGRETEYEKGLRLANAFQELRNKKKKIIEIRDREVASRQLQLETARRELKQKDAYIAAEEKRKTSEHIKQQKVDRIKALARELGIYDDLLRKEKKSVGPIGHAAGLAQSNEDTSDLIQLLEQAIIAHEEHKSTRRFEAAVHAFSKTANITTKTDDNDRFTLLHLAVMTRNPAIIRTILAAGGYRDLNTPDAKGRTPIQLALQAQ